MHLILFVVLLLQVKGSYLCVAVKNVVWRVYFERIFFGLHKFEFRFNGFSWFFLIFMVLNMLCELFGHTTGRKSLETFALHINANNVFLGSIT